MVSLINNNNNQNVSIQIENDTPPLMPALAGMTSTSSACGATMATKMPTVKTLKDLVNERIHDTEKNIKKIGKKKKTTQSASSHRMCRGPC